MHQDRFFVGLDKVEPPYTLRQMITVSVIIPLFEAQATLPRALASVRKAGLDLSEIEIILASDDGESYDAFAPSDISHRLTEIGPVQSGPGPTRNRALVQATGTFVAFLDADDTWEAGYLAELLPIAARQGVAFGPTQILNEDARPVLRTCPTGVLDLEEFGRTGASHHPLVRSDWAGPFENRPSQDILHAIEVLALAGGSLPTGTSAYEIHLRAQSVSRVAGYADRLDRIYQEIETSIKDGQSRVPAALKQRAAQVYAQKRQLNQAYLKHGSGQSFYDFIANSKTK